MFPRRAVSFSKNAVLAEDGSAAIEMAVSITALLMVIIGMMKMCLAVYTYHYTSEAAREGARYAIVRGATCVSGGSSCTATDDDVSSYVKGLLYPALDPTKMTVTVTRAGFPTGVTCSPNLAPNCNNPGNMITVKVQYAFPLAIPFRASQTLTMSSSSAGIMAQ